MASDTREMTSLGRVGSKQRARRRPDHSIAINWLQSMFLIAAGAIGVALGVFDLFWGDLNTLFPNLNNPQGITMMIVSLLALALGLERLTFFTQLSKDVESLAAQIEDVRQNTDILSEFEQRFQLLNSFTGSTLSLNNYYSIAVKHSMTSFSRILSSKTFDVEGERKTLVVWRECIREAKSWDAVSYAKEAWGSQLGFNDQISDTDQNYCIATGGKIRRVFLVEDMGEYAALESTMAKQAAMKVEIRWVPKDKMLARCGERVAHVDMIGGWDFSVVDSDNAVFCFRLDDDRKIIGSRLTIQAEVIQEASDIFEQIWAVAEPFR